MTTKQKDIYLKINISYLYARRWQFVFLWGVFSAIDYISRLPYLGLIFTFPTKIIVFMTVAIYVLKLHPKNTFLLGIFFVLFAAVNIFRGKTAAAETMGVIVYALLIIGFLQYFWLYMKRLKNNEINN